MTDSDLAQLHETEHGCLADWLDDQLTDWDRAWWEYEDGPMLFPFLPDTPVKLLKFNGRGRFLTPGFMFLYDFPDMSREVKDRADRTQRARFKICYYLFRPGGLG